MNKKLIALMIVPIMLTLSGAMAYSAFSGQAVTNIAAKAGTLSFATTVEVNNWYSKNTNISVSGGNGTETGTILIHGTSFSDYGGIAKGDTLFIYPVSAYSEYSFTVYLNVSNLAPGNWVEVPITITNGGSVGFILSGPSVGDVGTSGGTGNLNVTNVTSSVGNGNIFRGLEPSSTTPLSGVSEIGHTGYAYAISGVSGFGSSLDSGTAGGFNFYVGLSQGAGNNYQESSIHLAITVSVASDP